MINVKRNTTIFTDLWKAYFGRTGTTKGFQHFTANHSTNFIEPITSANILDQSSYPGGV